jgi:CBS domain-containing protein
MIFNGRPSMSDAEVHVTVEEVMSRPVATVEAETPVTEAAGRLYEEGIGSLIVEADGEPAGIVTETDVVGLVAREESTSVPVGEVASGSLTTIEGTARIEEAAERMRRGKIKKLPVTDDGAVVGMVTTTDVSNYFPSYHPREDGWT